MIWPEGFFVSILFIQGRFIHQYGDGQPIPGQPKRSHRPLIYTARSSQVLLCRFRSSLLPAAI